MPTLKEFVETILARNCLNGDPDEIVNKINQVARERAVNNVAAISDEEVAEMVINNAELSAKIAEEKAQKKAREEKERQERQEEEKTRKAAEKLEKQLEKEKKAGDGEQMSLFGWPSS